MIKVTLSSFGAELAASLMEEHIKDVQKSEWTNGLMTKEWYIAQCQGNLDELRSATSKRTQQLNKRFNR